ncbi:DUF1109 domain-containing protein [Xanthomonas sp. NCPPB 2654]|uniref:DUF1109 domain-containing protein n=1 Tax=unclassified Xanthomonas TaxID=2643310 RepID=UPI0021E0F761|nr:MULTISPECIES: DUF1109 domain-containing protein [unclassified Xanthomonas]MDL5367398.1 DUF1109 domain-containing protein [Xanthomonas sp. NCPPB 2654]UYC20686.1 DUF1109 domain-containing protein [Xanthomonas sp. CFBP 8443]
MKTDELIALLAQEPLRVDRHASAERFALALPSGLLGALLLASAVFGIRPDLAVATADPAFWAKLGFAACMAAGAGLAAWRLATPGRRVGTAAIAIGVPVVALWIAASAALWAAPADLRLPLLQGQSWHSCPFNIALLSIPSFASVFWALRGLAPTRLRVAGAAGGLLGGALATMAYCIHCPEMAVPFWALWYVLGMALPTALGAALGPRLLRW